jgi:dTDP-glucose 4,6-dehydratase
MKKILIIGSNSFSGSHFVNLLLNKKIKIFGMSRSREPRNEFLPYKNNKNLKNFIFHQFDLNKKNDRTKILKVIKKNNIKNIINFASQGMVEESFFNPFDWYKTNLLSTVAFVEKIKNENIDSYLHVSTPEVYGDLRETIYENSSKKPSTPYAISRLAMDYHLEAIAKMNKFPVKFSRAANVYGEGQKLYRIIPKTIIKILKNEKILLHGSGSSKRSFVHINDISEGYLKILEKGKIGESYHLSDNNFISIKELVIKICKKLNADYQKCVIEKKEDRLGKDFIYKLDSAKISNQLGWKTTISLESGIDRTIDWVKKNFSKFKNQNLEYIHKK